MSNSCRVYITNLSKDEKVQEKLTSWHNSIFQKLIDSKLFNKFNDHYFLPPVGSGRYTKAYSLISELNKEYNTPVVGTAYTKANSKEYVFVNVKNLLTRAQDEAKGPQQGVLFQRATPGIDTTDIPQLKENIEKLSENRDDVELKVRLFSQLADYEQRRNKDGEDDRWGIFYNSLYKNLSIIYPELSDNDIKEASNYAWAMSEAKFDAQDDAHSEWESNRFRGDVESWQEAVKRLNLQDYLDKAPFKDVDYKKVGKIDNGLLQKTSLVSSKASPKTIGKVKEWLSRIGIDIKTLDSKRYGGINGIANLLKATIEIAEGKESTALPEEAMHFAVDILKSSNPSLYKAMFNKIGQYNMYTLTRNSYESSPEYRLPDGSLNIPKIKEEAIGKLLAEYYIQKEEFSTEKPEFLLQTKTWWEQFVEWLKSLVGVANFNPFEEAVNSLPENNSQNLARIKELAELIQIQDVPTYMRDSIDQAFEAGEYREIVNTIAEQLADTPTYETTKDLYLGGDEALAQEILNVYQQFLQIEGETPTPNEFADSLIKKLEDKIVQNKLIKVEDEEAIDEENRNYYKATIGGKEVRPDRTTDYSKRANIKYTGGKDFFANLSPEEKAYNDKFAWNGLNVHFDIERIIQSARNEDGTIKPKGIFVPNIIPTVPKAVFKVLQNFLLGTDQTPGFLYQFEPGTKIVIEQSVLNDTTKTKTEDGKVLIGRAGTIDLLVMEPASEKHPKGLATIYDWKVMKMSEDKPDYPFPKQSQHKIQITDYKRTLKEGYGLKESEIQAFAIPIAGKYTVDEDRKTKVKTPKLVSVKIGNVDIRTEDRPYLLPVVPEDQSSGNPKIDALVMALNAKYQRIYKKAVPANQQTEKEEDLNEMSSAIRNLQVAINFEPLSVEALTFQQNVEKIIEKYETYSAIGKTFEEYNPVLREIASNINAASYYSDVDRVFSSEYEDTPNLSEKNKATLASLQKTSSAAKDSVDKLQDINKRIVAQIAADGGIANILSPEKEAKAITNFFIQSGSQPVKSLQFLTAITIDARSADQLQVSKMMTEFGDIYVPLTKLAASKGVSPYEMIADPEEHKLKRRLSRDVFDIIKKAKIDRDKKVILANIDVANYNKLAAEKIRDRSERLDLKPFSTDAVKDAKLRKEAKARLIRTFDINHKEFDGWKNKTVAQFIRQSIREEENYSDFYKELKNTPELKPALDMYNYILSLNEWAKELGYIESKHTEGFLVFINATLAQRVAASENKFKTFREAVGDIFTIQPDQAQSYGQKDPETGELTREIPTYFTGKKDKDKRTTDLQAILSLYIKSLIHYDTSQKLEPLFLSTLLMEKNKGHLEVDKASGKVIFQGDTPQTFPGNSVNAAKIQSYIDDQIFGINVQSGDLIDRAAAKIDSKEGKEARVVSAKKMIQAGNKLTQQLATGLKLLVAAPNFIGAKLQAVINSGTFSRSGEHEANLLKLIASKFLPGVRGDVQKGLIDLVVPLGEDNFRKQFKETAWKQSPLKALQTFSFNDVMMSTNRIPDVAHIIANADTWMKNTMVEDGKLVNIRKWLRDSSEFAGKYRIAEIGGKSVKESDKEFEAKIDELKKTRSLPEIAKYDSNNILIIPGFDMKNSNLAEYRAQIIEYSRKITSQISHENTSQYRLNIIARSFMMFKNWLVPQLEVRALDIHKNPVLDEWEYGRMRLFTKTLLHLGWKNIFKMRDIIKATPEGIRIMREILEKKQEEYYRKTGQKLEISEEEFFDMVRKELHSESKELVLFFTMAAMAFTIMHGLPPDDEDDPATKNRWKLLARLSTKASNELDFFYNPLSTEAITRGTFFPALGILSKSARLLTEIGKESFGDSEKAHPLKALFNLTPVASQFQNELAPLMFPEWTKEMSIHPTAEARAFQ